MCSVEEGRAVRSCCLTGDGRVLTCTKIVGVMAWCIVVDGNPNSSATFLSHLQGRLRNEPYEDNNDGNNNDNDDNNNNKKKKKKKKKKRKIF
jgi:hypothetical protein